MVMVISLGSSTIKRGRVLRIIQNVGWEGIFAVSQNMFLCFRTKSLVKDLAVGGITLLSQLVLLYLVCNHHISLTDTLFLEGFNK
jgi:hypothetical protein